jgi:hypothetical protein
MKTKDKNLETKREKFKRLATNRTNDLIKRLKVLSNLANKNIYDYTKSDVEQIFNYLEKKLKETKLRFDIHEGEEFKLD